MKYHVMSPYPPEQTSINKNLDKKPNKPTKQIKNKNKKH